MPSCDWASGVPPLQEEVVPGQRRDRSVLRRAYGHGVFVAQNPRQRLLRMVRPDIFISPVICFSQGNFLLFVHTLEDEPQPSSNYGTPQSRTIENGRIRRTSTIDTHTDQAGVKQIVEEQVCTSRSISLLFSCLRRYGPYNARLRRYRGNSSNRHPPILEK